MTSEPGPQKASQLPPWALRTPDLEPQAVFSRNPASLRSPCWRDPVEGLHEERERERDATLPTPFVLIGLWQNGAETSSPREHCPNRRSIRKRKEDSCLKPPSFGALCYTAVDTQNACQLNPRQSQLLGDPTLASYEGHMNKRAVSALLDPR